MRIRQIWTGNAYRNFNYLIACPESGEALAIDPLDSAKCLAAAREENWEITQILNTHEHHDHTGGNAAVVAATGAKILAHHRAGGKIDGVSRGLAAGDIVKVGKTVELEALDTPGHTMCHICLKSHTDRPALFTGDTLFNAGAGNCHNGGDAGELYRTFTEQIAHMADDTEVYPGHDYLENNLRFTMDREPGNSAAADMLSDLRHYDPGNPRVTTLGVERSINTFFRLDNPDVITRLRERFADLGADVDAKTVFLKLRELRNSW